MKFRYKPITTRKPALEIYWFYTLTLLVLGLDQFSKYLIEQNLGPYGSGKTLPLFGGLVFKFTKNSGASHNILENTSWLLAIIATVAAIGMVVYFHRFSPRNFWYSLSIGLILGGTLGNLSDRLFKSGFVTDFIHIDWLPLFKNFNLADTSLRLGVIIFILTFLTQQQRKQEPELALDHRLNLN